MLCVFVLLWWKSVSIYFLFYFYFFFYSAPFLQQSSNCLKYFFNNFRSPLWGQLNWLCKRTAITVLCAYSYFLISCWYCAPFFCATDCFHIPPPLPCCKSMPLWPLWFGLLKYDLRIFNLWQHISSLENYVRRLPAPCISRAPTPSSKFPLLWVCIFSLFFSASSGSRWGTSNAAVANSAAICCCHMPNSSSIVCRRGSGRGRVWSLVAGRWSVGKRTQQIALTVKLYLCVCACCVCCVCCVCGVCDAWFAALFCSVPSSALGFIVWNYNLKELWNVLKLLIDALFDVYNCLFYYFFARCFVVFLLPFRFSDDKLTSLRSRPHNGARRDFVVCCWMRIIAS